MARARTKRRGTKTTIGQIRKIIRKRRRGNRRGRDSLTRQYATRQITISDLVDACGRLGSGKFGRLGSQRDATELYATCHVAGQSDVLCYFVCRLYRTVVLRPWSRGPQKQCLSLVILSPQVFLQGCDRQSRAFLVLKQTTARSAAGKSCFS